MCIESQHHFAGASAKTYCKKISHSAKFCEYSNAILSIFTQKFEKRFVCLMQQSLGNSGL